MIRNIGSAPPRKHIKQEEIEGAENADHHRLEDEEGDHVSLTWTCTEFQLDTTHSTVNRVDSRTKNSEMPSIPRW